jgi:hypothetical protein
VARTTTSTKHGVRPKPSTPASSPRGTTTTAMPQMGTRMSAGQVMDLQRTAGNQATQRLLAPGDARSRSASPGGPVQVSRDVGTAEDTRLLDALVGLRNQLGNVLELHAAAYQRRMEETRPVYGRVLADSSRNFERAWGTHNGVLRTARLDAQSENMVRGVVIGAVASVAVAAVAAAIPPVAAVGAASFSGGWWASTAAQAAIGSAGGAWVGSYLEAPTNFEPAVPRELGQLRQLQQLLTFEQNAARAHLGVSNVGRVVNRMGIIIDELQADPGNPTVRADAQEFLARRSQMEDAGPSYFAAFQAVTSFKERIEGWQAPDPRRLERLIWVHWIASLRESDHDLLDRDAVEDYLHGSIGVLGRSGILGVDTRRLFDTAEEKQAIRNARREQVNLEVELAAGR